MRIETISLPTSGYGSRVPTLTTYVLDNVAAQAERKRPAIIICPGGGYEFCADRESEPVAIAFTARGYQAFVLDYTVLDETEIAAGRCLLPAPQRDLAHAVSTVRAHADEWGIDSDSIIILGFSAGGHLCASYSALSRRQEFAADLCLTCEEIAVNAQVLCYAAVDLASGWPRNPEHVRTMCSDAVAELVTTQHLVDAMTPRTFLWHTAEDATVPVHNAYIYADALATAGVDHECHVFHRGRHGLSLATTESSKAPEYEDAHIARWLDLVVEWLGDTPAGIIEHTDDPHAWKRDVL